MKKTWKYFTKNSGYLAAAVGLITCHPKRWSHIKKTKFIIEIFNLFIDVKEKKKQRFTILFASVKPACYKDLTEGRNSHNTALWLAQSAGTVWLLLYTNIFDEHNLEDNGNTG